MQHSADILEGQPNTFILRIYGRLHWPGVELSAKHHLSVAMQCRVEVFHDATTFVVKRCHAAKIPNHDHAIC